MSAMRSAVAMLGTVAMLAAQPGATQEYPRQPIKLIVGAAPGGLVDIAARIASDYLDRALRQRVLVENRPGAGGTLGANAVAKAPPDGYTLGLLTLNDVAVSPFVYKESPYDPLNDLVPIAAVTASPLIVAVNAEVPAKTLREFIALAKSRPGKFSYGSGGVASIPHLAGVTFSKAAGVEIVHVPYRGVGPAVTDLAAGQVQIVFAGLGALRGQLAGGRIRALAASQERRLAGASNIPTASEAGLADWELATWFGIMGPRGLPQPIITKLAQITRAMLDDPAVLQRLTDGGLEPLKDTSEQFRARVRRDHDRFRAIVKAAEIQPE